MNPHLVLFLSIAVSFLITFAIMPRLIKKMYKANICGTDVNKIDKPKIPEMGGIAGVLGFTLGSTFILGIVKYFDSIDETPVLVSISVVCIASLIGLLNDVSILGRKEKAWFISLASLPLIISQIGSEEINFIIYSINLAEYSIYFWILLVPLGITGCANALNMSAGYNGLESGQFAIISFTLLLISFFDNTDISIKLIYSSIFGTSLALYYYNKYPSRVFLGDIATLGFGALVAACVIMSGHIIYGVVCILPTFYEMFSTIKYSINGIERRQACMNPILTDSGLIKPPSGSEDYTLAFFILSKWDLNERQVVTIILSIYLFFGILSVSLFYIFE